MNKDYAKNVSFKLGGIMKFIENASSSSRRRQWSLGVAAALLVAANTVWADGGELEEIVVTAQYRDQSIQSVPITIRVFDGASLDRAGARGFADYILSVPSVSLRDQGSGSKRLAIRGVSNIAGSDVAVASTVSTVGLYINDVPIQGTSILPDIGLYDLERIEVLKGPQGTLYGEGAMGGAVRMILNKPDLSEPSLKGDLTISSTEDGGSNTTVRAAGSVPIVKDRLAMNVVGTYSDNSGFVDNIATGVEDFNSGTSSSLRTSVLASFTDRLSAEFLYMRSDQEMDGFPYIDTTLSDLEVSIREPLTGDLATDVTALTFNWDVGFASLTSVSSYFTFDRDNQLAFRLVGAFFRPFGPVNQEPLSIAANLDSFSQELRLVSSGDERLDWVLGFYYRDKEQETLARWFIAQSDLPGVNAGLAAANRALLPPSGLVLERPFKDKYEQYAVYGEIRYELTAALEATVGFRWYDEKTTAASAATFYSYLAANSSPWTSNSVNDSGVVPKFSLTYDASDDVMIYATVAEGFRSATINPQAQLVGVGDVLVESDTLTSYELGIKTTLLDSRATLNAAVFYSDWKDIQSGLVGFSTLLNRPVGFVGNGPDGEIRGVEAELKLQAADWLSIGMAAGYNDSEVTKAAYDIRTGQSLPNAPELTASASADLQWPMFGTSTGLLHIDVTYQDEQNTRFMTPAVPDGAPLESFTVANLRAGLEFGRWGIDLFANNLFDERAQLGVGQGTVTNFDYPTLRTINRPRTIGLMISAGF